MVNKPAMAGKSGAARSTAARGHGDGPVARKRRVPGRPRSENSEDVRERLLTVARELFLRYGYRAVSSRQISSAAGANVAMIRYYFGGKPGLYREIFNTLVQPIRAGVDAMTQGLVTVELGSIVEAAMRVYAANPWLPGLVIREVLMPDGPLRGMFVKEFPERVAPLIEKIVQQEIERGHLRAGLDPKLTVLSMLSLALFPFLALSVTSKVFGVRQDEEFLQRFIGHTREVLAHGIAGPQATEKTL